MHFQPLKLCSTYLFPKDRVPLLWHLPWYAAILCSWGPLPDSIPSLERKLSFQANKCKHLWGLGKAVQKLILFRRLSGWLDTCLQYSKVKSWYDLYLCPFLTNLCDSYVKKLVPSCRSVEFELCSLKKMKFILHYFIKKNKQTIHLIYIYVCMYIYHWSHNLVWSWGCNSYIVSWAGIALGEPVLYD